MENNRGVTLIELLIVIVVMGIISAFAVPAVGKIIDNTEKDRVYADALALADAVTLYCASNLCEPQPGRDYYNINWKKISPYINGIDEEYYALNTYTLVARVENGEIGNPRVRLRAIDPTDYSWYRLRDPSDPAYDRNTVTTQE